MKKFIKNVLLMTLITVGAFCLLAVFDYFVVKNQYELNYQAAIIDKVERLESIDEPKIILVGHSNLAFGIDSQMLEEAIGMPVVNLGLHGGLGNAFHEEIAKLNINEGDIVIVCHSSFSDGDQIDDVPLAWITVGKDAKLWKIIREKDYGAMLKGYPGYLRDSILLWITRSGNKDDGGSYSRNAFNEYGDVAYKPENGKIDVEAFFEKTRIAVPQIGGACVRRLNEYNEYITSKGATLLIAGYPIAYGEYADFEEEDFRAFQTNLQKCLNCDVISDYTDYFFPYEYFYDTAFHLTQEGTQHRTQQLISDIENWIADQ